MINDLSKLFRRTPKSGSHPQFSADTALAGLPTDLVISLARLAGATLDDLSITCTLMPYHDRVVMSAYGLITMSAPDNDGNRSIDAQPFCLEVISAAAELIASVVDPASVAARLAIDANVGRLTDTAPYVPSVNDGEHRSPDEASIEAIVQESFEENGRTFVKLSFVAPPLYELTELDHIAAREASSQGGSTLIVTDGHVDLPPNTAVQIAYPISDLLRVARLSVIKTDA